ncbi:glutamate receptor ionotropic, kainate 2-like isoform X2 [Choristoneura fumiferana]
MRVLDGMMLLATMFLMFQTSIASEEPTVKIGVVSSPAQVHNMAAAVEAALIAGNVIPDVRLGSVEPDEPLDMAAQVCAKAQEGVSAILAYGEAEEVKLASAAAARVGVPLLLVSPTPFSTSTEGLLHWETIHMYPQNDVFIKACTALCDEKAWSSAVLLHDDAVGPRLVQGAGDAGLEIAILARRLPPPEDEESLRNLLLVLKKAEHTQFIVWCDEACVDRVLAAAQIVGLLSERHSYILLALDLHTLDLEPYSHGGANITGLQLFDPEREEPMLMDWRETYLRRFRKNAEDMDVSESYLEAAETEADKVVATPLTSLILAYDVVLTASKILGRLANITMDLDETSCEPLKSNGHADTLINYLRSKDISNWAGNAGSRRSGRFRVVELARRGILMPVGIYDPRFGIMWDRPPVEAPPLPPGVMANQTFVVLIMINKPYVMMKPASHRLSGNDRYEGFCIELFEKLSNILHFNFTLLQLPGGNYDMMLERIQNSSEPLFAITDLTITAEREQKVDFTTPFMNLGISILYRKPTAPVPKMFAFMLPFSTGVWFCLGLAYVGTSLVLYVIGRLCPEEWQNPYPCIEEPDALENQFTLANALWFTLGAILCQGSEIAPVAYGSRAVASAWWIFALVITSSYTANLATLLAKKSNNEDFTNVAELATNKLGITYGAKVGGSTYKFLQHSQEGLFKEMFEKMQKWDMPSGNPAGIDRVNQDPSEGKFAFLMESTSIEYEIERNCNLTQMGGLIDSKGYGIAMAKNSSYRQALNLALLNLQEAGELRIMKHRWWREMNGGGGCDAEEQPANEKLKMRNF